MSTREVRVNGSLAIAPPRYSVPELAWTGETAQVVTVVWWAIIVGWSFSLALAYASYCIYSGGSPDIELTWRGFKVTCER